VTFHGYVIEKQRNMQFDHFLTIPHRALVVPPLRSTGAGPCTGLSTAGVDKVKNRFTSGSCATFVAAVTASRCKRWTGFGAPRLSLD
jgi:hypothetical protein